MIKPITKDYFYKLVGEENEGFITKSVDLKNVSSEEYRKIGDKDKEFSFASLDLYLYFEKPGDGAFVYLYDLRRVIVPKVFESIKIDENEEVDFSDWKLETVSSIPNKIYTINCLSYTSGYHDYLYSCESKLMRLKEGEFIIKNDRIGFATEPITVRKITTWHTDVFIGYPEKLKIPHDMTILSKKDKILKNMLLWTQS